MNYKIRVANEAESKEAQELLFELGGCWATCGRSYNNMVELGDYVFLTDSSMLNYGLGIGKEEITIPQLRDMVVLKRNDVNDKNVKDGTIHDLYQASNGTAFFYHHHKKKWIESEINKSASYMADVKPITKEPAMKEFLVKSQDGKWRLETEVVGDTGDDIIEVPEGADKAFQAFSNAPVVFKRSECGYSNAVIVWQRETLNDKVASAEVARQEFIGVPFSDLPEFNFEAVDEFVESNVEQTLIDRESTYGSFRDVAELTSSLMNDLLRLDMSFVQREALHMICSKLARIANGDPYHVDSWHDIAGYASLVVKDINGNP